MDLHIQWPWATQIYIVSPISPSFVSLISGNGIKIHSIAHTRNLGCHPCLLLLSPPTANPHAIHVLPVCSPSCSVSLLFSVLTATPHTHPCRHHFLPMLSYQRIESSNPTPFSILWLKWFISKTILVLRPTFPRLHSE